MCLKQLVVCIVAFGLIGMQSANAALQIAQESDIAPDGGAVHDPFQPVFSGGSASDADLLEGMLPSSSTGNFAIESSAGTVALTNGTDITLWPEGGTGGDAIDHAPYAAGGNNAGTSLTYSVGGRYTLSSFTVYGGWNDGGRDAQRFDVLTSTDGGTNFTLLGTFDQGTTGSDTGNPIGYRTEFSEDTLPYIAENVSNLRFDFLDVEKGHTGYSEIDLFGDRVDVPGDANGGGFVAIDDFYVISDHFLQTPSVAGTDGDLDANNFVDAVDLRTWKDLAPVAVLAQLNGIQVPEPGPLSMLAFATRCWSRSAYSSDVAALRRSTAEPHITRIPVDRTPRNASLQHISSEETRRKFPVFCQNSASSSMKCLGMATSQERPGSTRSSDGRSCNRFARPLCPVSTVLVTTLEVRPI